MKYKNRSHSNFINNNNFESELLVKTLTTAKSIIIYFENKKFQSKKLSVLVP